MQVSQFSLYDLIRLTNLMTILAILLESDADSIQYVRILNY